MMPGNILDSWKAVAQYLKYSVRTCQRLEREAGLPIHRIDDTPKARICAYPGEIDRWFEKTAHHHLPSPGRRAAKWAALAAAPVLVVAGLLAFRAGLIVRNSASPGRPAVSLAILPFLNDTGDASFDALADRLQRRLMDEIEATAARTVVIGRPAVAESLEALGPIALKDLSESNIQTIIKRTEATHLLLGHFWREAGSWTLSYDLYRAKGPPSHGVVKGGTDERHLPSLVAGRVVPALGTPASTTRRAGPPDSEGKREESSPLLEAAQAAERAYVSGCDRKDLLLAIELFRQAGAAQPDSAAALFGLGHCLQNDFLFHGADKATFEAMAAAYHEALQLAPNLPEAQLGMGWSCLLSGQRDEAYGWFVKAHDLAPSSPRVNYHVGSFLGYIGLPDKAVVYLTRAIDLGERSTRAYRMRAFYRGFAGDFRGAAEDSAKLCEMNPTKARMFSAYARDLLLLRDLDGAERQLGIAEVLDPEDWDVRLSRALVLAARGEEAKALEVVGRFREGSTGPSRDVAAIYALLGRAEAAVAELRAVMETNRTKFQRAVCPFRTVNDPDFFIVDQIRSHPGFLGILKDLEAEQNELLRRYSGL